MLHSFRLLFYNHFQEMHKFPVLSAFFALLNNIFMFANNSNTIKIGLLFEEEHMKATGIVRRIDELGRVVIPKEIRRTLRIREGDPLEIFTEREGNIILKKYSPIGELNEYAN